MEQQDHACPVRDGIVQTHLLATALERLKVADSVENELLLFLAQDHLRTYVVHMVLHCT